MKNMNTTKMIEIDGVSDIDGLDYSRCMVTHTNRIKKLKDA